MLIETNRLALRPLEGGDLDEFFALQNDPQVVRFMRRLDHQQAGERLRAIEAEWEERGYGMFSATEHASGRFLGRAGLKYWPQLDETEVGWGLRSDAWGHGYATEAARDDRLGLSHLRLLVPHGDDPPRTMRVRSQSPSG